VTSERRPWAYERGTLWASEPGDATPAPVPPHTEVTLGELRREDAAALAAAMGLLDQAPIQERFTAPRRCFVAWDGDRIAAYGWASQGYECVGELEREFHMQPDEAYIWDCATMPEYRAKRLYSALLGYMLAELRRSGVGRVWIGASLDNRPSIKGFVNAGFRPAITLVYRRLLALRCLWIRGYPSAPARLVAAARRMIVADDEVSLGPLILGIDRD
jgi:ribosomal protein S18 acetylase RimI-like enzyme